MSRLNGASPAFKLEYLREVIRQYNSAPKLTTEQRKRLATLVAEEKKLAKKKPK